jgi:hypothetical protein
VDALVVAHHHDDVRAGIGLALALGGCGREAGDEARSEQRQGDRDHSQNGLPCWWRSRPSMPAQDRSRESRSARPICRSEGGIRLEAWVAAFASW